MSSFEELVDGELRQKKIKLKKKYTKPEAVQMMVYTISEMKVIMEEYKEMQIFVREASSEDL